MGIGKIGCLKQLKRHFKMKRVLKSAGNYGHQSLIWSIFSVGATMLTNGKSNVP